MRRRLAFLPRLVLLTVVWLLLTAALTYAAGERLTTAPTPARAPAAPAVAPPVTVVVPDVRRQVYVFAKGMLEDAGFAWRVQGPVRGYAANTVVDQAPAPGTRLLDTGAPTIVLRLRRGPGAQVGQPEDTAPFPGTALRLADAADAPARLHLKAKAKVKAKRR